MRSKSWGDQSSLMAIALVVLLLSLWVGMKWLVISSLCLLLLLVLLTQGYLPRFARFKLSGGWRSLACKGIAFLLLLVVGFISPLGVALANSILARLLPTDPGTPVDAIVVLGRGKKFRRERLDLAYQLWNKNRAPRIFISGMSDAKPMISLLKKKGLSHQVISGENCSQTTFENALFTSTVLKHQNVRTILLITDISHMERSLLLFRQFGFNVIPKPVILSSTDFTMQQAKLLAREVFALAAYHLGQQSKLKPSQYDRLFQKAKETIADWNCVVKSAKGT